MKWFTRREDFAELEKQVNKLRDRVFDLECKQHTFEVGKADLLHNIVLCAPRQQVTHAEAIQLLMDHLGLEFEAIPAQRGGAKLVKRANK